MDALNSRGADYSPMLQGEEGERLYFTSTRNEAEGDELSGITGTKPGDIFLSERDDQGRWSKPEAIVSGLNTECDEGACCFSPDGREMYLTRCVTDPSYPRYAQIVVSPRSDAAWGEASPLEISADTLSSYAHPAVSPDGEWLYFGKAHFLGAGWCGEPWGAHQYPRGRDVSHFPSQWRPLLLQRWP